MACDPTQHADLAAVIMQEGLAHVCLITTSMTLVRAKIDVTVPRKRKGNCAQHTKVLISSTAFIIFLHLLILRSLTEITTKKRLLFWLQHFII